MNHPIKNFDTAHSHTAATNLAREELLKVSAYDEVVDLLQAAYSALFDAAEQLENSVSVEDHEDQIEYIEKERDKAEEELREAKSADAESLKAERDRAFEQRDRAQDELGKMMVALEALRDRVTSWIGSDPTAIVTSAHWYDLARERGLAVDALRAEIAQLRAPPKRRRASNGVAP